MADWFDAVAQSLYVPPRLQILHREAWGCLPPTLSTVKHASRRLRDRRWREDLCSRLRYSSGRGQVAAETARVFASERPARVA